MASVVALGPEAAVTLQFLDRRQGEWYCVDCLADAVGLDGVDERGLHSLAVSLSTREASAARREFEAAWKNADTQLKVEDL